MKKYLVYSLIFILLIISACTTASKNDEETKVRTGNTVELPVEAYSWGFIIDSVTIKKGDLVRLKITSSSGTHGIYIPEFGVNTDPISPGEEQIVEFIADKSGKFNYYCNVLCGAGHSSMVGKLEVE